MRKEDDQDVCGITKFEKRQTRSLIGDMKKTTSCWNCLQLAIEEIVQTSLLFSNSNCLPCDKVLNDTMRMEKSYCTSLIFGKFMNKNKVIGELGNMKLII